jgi:hypothetical protein
MSYNNILNNLVNAVGQSASNAAYNATRNHLQRRDTSKAFEALETRLGTADHSNDSELINIVRLCLIRNDATISIPNIARLTTGSQTSSEIKNFSTASKAIGAAGAIVLAVSGVMQSAPVALAAIAIFAVAFFIPRKLTKARTLRKLFIHTNDGGEYMFFAFDQDVIDRVRAIITDKMNGLDEATVYNINLEKGIIQNMQVGNIGSVGAIVTGDGNQVSAAAGNARVNTTETTTNISVIDYSAALPVVAEWKEYLRKQNHVDVAERFDELERLLKAGTPTPEAKYKLRDLLQDLGNVFSSSTNAIQLFDMIRKLAGL